MKKPALLVLGVLLIALISIYFIIPRYITTTNKIDLDATDVKVAKFLVNKKQWPKWWPGQHIPADTNLFIYKGTSYMLQKSTNGSIDVAIKKDGIDLNSTLTYLAADEGECIVTWNTSMQSSVNPFTRVTEYFKSKQQAKHIGNLLHHFKKFMQTDTNVYGLKVKVVKITQPLVLAIQTNTSSYPPPAVIYSLTDKLKAHIAAQGGKDISPPMLNATRLNSNAYSVTVGLVINKQLQPGNGIVVNNMVMGANLLCTQVKGGHGTINNALYQLKNYQKDHGLISPAVPFEQLITNRLTEKDSSKWVTKILWPIF